MKKIFTLLLVFTLFFANAQTPGENFNVNHYEIHINNLDFSGHTIQGETMVTATTTAPCDTVVLELKSLEVTYVTSQGYGVSNFWQEDDLLYVIPNIPLPVNVTFTLDIVYGGNTFNDGWGGILWSGNYVCNMGVGFESIPHNLGKTWFPCVDNFTDKASYDVYVTVPTETTAVCGGNLESDTDNGDDTHTVHYNMPQEIATYHISFVAGDYVEWIDTYNGINSDIPVNVYVKPNQINKVDGTFVHVKDIAAFYESCFGPYPFNRIGYSITSVGCMEHVDNIGITSGILTGNTSQEEYIAHELSHMYFGNKVTCATAEDMWLNEGFAQFCGVFYRSDIYGEDDFQQNMNTKTNTITNWCKSQGNWIPLNNVPQTMTYDGNAVYNRGAVVVNTMMNYLGRETFLEGLRSYLNSHAYGTASSEELRDALTAATGIDMSGFFDTYVFTAGMPHYDVDIINVSPNGSQYDVTVKMTYKHYGPEHVGQNNRVEITFINDEGQLQTTMVNWDGAESEQTLTIGIDPIVAFADYYNHFLDAKLAQNKTATSNTNFTVENLKVKVTNVTDSVMLRVEGHLVGPDDPEIPALTISTRHFWNVMRLDMGEATVKGEFLYHYDSSMDGDIIHTQNDSAVLVYRANCLDTWHTIPYTIQHNSNWMAGTFIVDDLLTGQYTIAAIDKSMLGIEESISDAKKMIIAPNPTDNIIRISTQSENSDILIINCLGQILNYFPISGNETTVSISDYPAGVYYVILIDKKKIIISTEKLIKK